MNSSSLYYLAWPTKTMFARDGPVLSKILNLHSVVNLITETFTGNVHRYMNCSMCLENKGDKILNEVPNDF